MYVVTMGVINKNLTLLKEEKTAEYRSGSLNIDKVVFNFSGSEWEGLTKIAVFVTESGDVIDVPLIGNYCIIPREAYITSHTDFRDVDFYYDIAVGVYGQYIDSETNKITKILPTNLVRRKVRLGSYLPGVTPSDLPTAEQWQLYIDEVGRLASIAQASEAACVEIKEAIQEIYEDIQKIEDNVESLESSANNFAQNAYNYANYAGNYANNSQEYANLSQSYMNNSLNYANLANQSAINAKGYENNAKQYSENAHNSEINAWNYSNNAYNSANRANNDAINASLYANNASNYSNSAYNYSRNSSNYANSSWGYANNAYNSATLASSYANNAQSYMNSAHDYSDAANNAYNNSYSIYNEIWDISAARMFAAFDVNPKNGDLIMTTVQSMGNIGFSIDANGNLVITLS